MNLRKTLIASAILATGLVGSVSAHPLFAGKLAAAQNSTDVFRTTCVNFDGVTYQAPVVPDVTGNASGFVFEISLNTGSTVTATVGYTGVGNVNGNTWGNNILPASPAPKTATATDTSLSTAWNPNAATPEFGANGYLSPSLGAVAGFLNPAGTASGAGNGQYVVVVSHASTVSTGYDFLGHCWLSANGKGLYTANHTGQGTWFTGAPLAPTFDYDQVLDQ
ncbi:hypothetical protein [Methylomonas sp. AM2-LC]|uniref:hypothetical protein n=1 Tax=Methylomonas sp. AM2-LC TaxID=3153301 RepID=UPI00326568CD